MIAQSTGGGVFHGTCRVIESGRLEEFLAKGYKQRHFFPHAVYRLPKAGPDGQRLAQWMGIADGAVHRQVVLYGLTPAIDEFPDELFFDRELIWHQQHFGLPGQVATANLVLKGPRVYTNTHLSDLVQRISRRREYKTRIENRFKGWPVLLLNAILDFARDAGAIEVYSPTARHVLRFSDPARKTDPAMFEQIYDQTTQRFFNAERRGDWWRLGLAENAERIVSAHTHKNEVRSGKIIAVCHDIERGLGHRVEDPAFAHLAEQQSRQALPEMLTIEQRAGVRATYSVVGCFLGEVREQILARGHICAFHSYDHVIERGWKMLAARLFRGRRPQDQLRRCRLVDYRLKGYRPPQSRITRELADDQLRFHNFEWLASGADSLHGTRTPRLSGGVVKIPILFDDYALYTGAQTYETWEAQALRAIGQHDFVAFSLHDCYAQFWLPHYERLLEQVQSLGATRTLDQVSAETLLDHAL